MCDEIAMLKGEKRKIKIYQKGESISFYAKMNELEEMLQQYGFVRCHLSYLVNKKYITGSSRTEIKVGESVLPISRRYQEEIKKIL